MLNFTNLNPSNTMPTIYISGPMTGLPDHNFPAFHAEAARLRALGYSVINPAELNPDQTSTRHQCMRNDIRALCDCDALALLPGWGPSDGAQTEIFVAHKLGLTILSAAEITS
jgi:hypothetical protein